MTTYELRLITGEYMTRLKKCEATGGKVVIDSAFALGQRGHFIKSAQLDPMDAQELLRNQDATSVCQFVILVAV